MIGSLFICWCDVVGKSPGEGDGRGELVSLLSNILGKGTWRVKRGDSDGDLYIYIGI